jgi:hypothetical protein
MFESLVLAGALVLAAPQAQAPKTCEELVEEHLAHYMKQGVKVAYVDTDIGIPGLGNVLYYLNRGKQWAVLALISGKQTPFSTKDKVVYRVSRRDCTGTTKERFTLYLDGILEPKYRKKGGLR